MTFTQRIAFASLMLGAFGMGVMSAFVGVEMHSISGEFDLGSLVQWASLGLISISLTGLLYSILSPSP